MQAHGGEQNAAGRRVKNISDVKGSSVAYTTGQLSSDVFQWFRRFLWRCGRHGKRAERERHPKLRQELAFPPLWYGGVGWLGRASTTLHCTHHMPHTGSRDTTVSFLFHLAFSLALSSSPISSVTLGNGGVLCSFGFHVSVC